jgi:hypothetical protein
MGPWGSWTTTEGQRQQRGLRPRQKFAWQVGIGLAVGRMYLFLVDAFTQVGIPS